MLSHHGPGRLGSKHQIGTWNPQPENFSGNTGCTTTKLASAFIAAQHSLVFRLCIQARASNPACHPLHSCPHAVQEGIEFVKLYRAHVGAVDGECSWGHKLRGTRSSACMACVPWSKQAALSSTMPCEDAALWDLACTFRPGVQL